MKTHTPREELGGGGFTPQNHKTVQNPPPLASVLGGDPHCLKTDGWHIDKEQRDNMGEKCETLEHMEAWLSQRGNILWCRQTGVCRSWPSILINSGNSLITSTCYQRGCVFTCVWWFVWLFVWFYHKSWWRGWGMAQGTTNQILGWISIQGQIQEFSQRIY